ncbi:MAG: hypothetical protein EOP49_08340 [Sphingobacteriales bacterium]|nr:MAG: hypothetical protein EOP49_08340 [Sphingobacteriales bacterium]
MPQFIAAQDIVSSISHRSLEGIGGEVLEVEIQIHNRTASDTLLNVHLAADAPLQVISKKASVVDLSRGETFFFPVRVYVPASTPSDTVYRIIVQYKSNSSELPTDTCMVTIRKLRQVNMFLPHGRISVATASDSVTIPVRLVNSGNSPQAVSVVARIPELNNGDFYQVLHGTLAPNADTIVFLHRKLTGNLKRKAKIAVNFNGLYGDGTIFGSTTADFWKIRLSIWNRTAHLGCSQLLQGTLVVLLKTIRSSEEVACSSLTVLSDT